MPHPKPITYKECKVCGRLQREGLPTPIVGSFLPQTTLNNIKDAPFHNWYFFTLGYSPKFVDYVIESRKIGTNHVILDPFMGSGTTLVSAKMRGIPSVGIDANDFMVFAAAVKINWDLQVNLVQHEWKKLLASVDKTLSSLPSSDSQMALTDFLGSSAQPDIHIKEDLQELLDRRYISYRPLLKVLAILSEAGKIENSVVRDLFELAVYSILVPASNVRYGPGFGIGPIKHDVDVLGLFNRKVARMVDDLQLVDKGLVNTRTKVVLGDSRQLSEILGDEKVDFMITSPPYPGDHEYTRHTRLELVVSGLARNTMELRSIKKRMVRSSTRSVYGADHEASKVSKFQAIGDLMDEIDRRVRDTNSTSGFEKLYSKVVGEYFGGMYAFLQELKGSMNDNGVAAFLVGDSHAFKMVHVETAKLLGELALDIGFSSYELELWWNKRSTAHSFYLPEYILNLKC